MGADAVLRHTHGLGLLSHHRRTHHHGLALLDHTRISVGNQTLSGAPSSVASTPRRRQRAAPPNGYSVMPDVPAPAGDQQ